MPRPRAPGDLVIRADIPPGSVVRFVGRFQQNISTPPIIASDAVTVADPS